MARVLILCEYPTLLGGERSMLATLPAVAAADFDVLVAAPPAGPLADILRAQGVSRVVWQTHDDGGQRFPLDRLREDLANLMRQMRPNLLHANSLSTARISGPVAAKVGDRSIGHLRDILKLAPQAVDDLNAHRRLLAVSRATRDYHVSQGIAAEKCVVKYNGVNLFEYCPRPRSGYLHRELASPPNTRFSAVIGQLGLRKGTDVALAAALRIAAQFPDLHWLIVGERTSNKDEAREFEELLRSIASEAPLVGRVHFLGNRTDVPLLLAECDLLVHAARQEPLGRILLEAAACGLAVIATDVGGTGEIFPAESRTAVLVPPDNHSALADAIQGALQDGPSRKQLGAAARQRAELAFDIRDAAVRLVDHYRSLLA
jgi:glycosyltransferase involved in cell wall biosynthesis